MPEGPEIFTQAKRLNRLLKGKPIDEIYFKFSDLKPFEDELRGSSVLGVRSRSKALLIDLDCGQSIYSHNQLYGRWYLSYQGKTPETSRDLRLRLRSGKKRIASLYSASEIDVLDTSQVEDHPYLQSLGLDLFDDSPSHFEVLNFLHGKKFQRRRLVHLLLDQSFLAGMGNYLRSEVLFLERQNFQTRPVDLSNDEMMSIYQTAKRIAKQSAQNKGITNDLKMAENMKRDGYRKREYRHWVFGRAGKPCFVCGSQIQKNILSGRRVFTCPHCQEN